MAFCMFSGDSFKSLAMEGSEVLRMVESSICIKIAVARMSGRTFFTVWRGDVFCRHYIKLKKSCEISQDFLTYF